MVDVVLEVEWAGAQGHVPRVVPVGEVDVVIGEQRLYGPAEQRGEVARQGGHHQHLRLARRLGLAEAQQRAEGRAGEFLLDHLDIHAIDRDAGDAVVGPLVGHAEAGEQLERRRGAPRSLAAGQGGPETQHGLADTRHCLHGQQQVGLRLVTAIQHRYFQFLDALTLCAPSGGCETIAFIGRPGPRRGCPRGAQPRGCA